MFNNLTIWQIAEIVMCLLNADHLEDMEEVQQCFEIMLNETKKPKYQYKSFPDLIAAADEEDASFIQQYFQNTPDYLFDVINTTKISMEALSEVIGLCIEPVNNLETE